MATWPKIADISTRVQKGELKAADLVKQSIELIEQNKDYGAIISATKERAVERAKAIDEKAQKGETVGPLAGVPFIAKDDFLTFGGKTTAAAKYLKDFEAP